MHYTVVVDLEMCNVTKTNQKQYHYKHEIIQIGAAVLDEDYQIVDGFNCFVKPEYGHIDSFIRDLTGIGQADVRGAERLEDALNDFQKWLPQDVTITSWSMSDRYQLLHETEAKGIAEERLNELLESWEDCQVLFSEKMKNGRKYSLTEALIAADISGVDRAHDGLSDAYNTALLYRKMKMDPDFKLNKYYAEAREAEEPLTVCVGDLFKGLDLSAISVA